MYGAGGGTTYPNPSAQSLVGGGGGATQQPYVVPSRPTQADLEAIVDTETAAEADGAWDDPTELAIHALLHRAWCMEIARKGWNVESEIGSIHIKALRMAQAAIRLIPKREPIA